MPDVPRCLAVSERRCSVRTTCVVLYADIPQAHRSKTTSDMADLRGRRIASSRRRGASILRHPRATLGHDLWRLRQPGVVLLG